jgi:hypothetical protein
MRGNFSQSPHDHEEALSWLSECDYHFIPKIYHFDNNSYCCEKIKNAVPLKQYMEETADFDVAIKAIETISTAFLEVSQCIDVKNNLRLIPDDIHDENLIVDENKNIYIVDLDMFGWWPPSMVFQKMGTALSTVCHSIKYGSLHFKFISTISSYISTSFCFSRNLIGNQKDVIEYTHSHMVN